MRYSLPMAMALMLLPLGRGVGEARADDDTLEQRREQLEQMSDIEKNRLLEKKSRFDKLPREEKDRLRILQRELSTDPQCEHLRGVLERYSEWLKTLSAFERAELSKLKPEERLEHIKQLVSDQDAKRFGMMVGRDLHRKDLEAIRKWFDEFVKAHASEILATVPDDPRFAEVKKSFDPEKHLLFLRFWYLQHDQSKQPQPTKEDEEKLKGLLTPEAREVLNKAKNDAERSRIVQNWSRAADWSSRVPPPVSKEELDRFVKEELSDSERAYLESLPRDRMYFELRLKYYQKRFGMRGPGGRRGRGGRSGFDGKPPGSDGPGFRGKPGPPPDEPPASDRSPGKQADK